MYFVYSPLSFLYFTLIQELSLFRYPLHYFQDYSRKFAYYSPLFVLFEMDAEEVKSFSISSLKFFYLFSFYFTLLSFIFKILRLLKKFIQSFVFLTIHAFLPVLRILR